MKTDAIFRHKYNATISQPIQQENKPESIAQMNWIKKAYIFCLNTSLEPQCLNSSIVLAPQKKVQMQKEQNNSHVPLILNI